MRRPFATIFVCLVTPLFTALYAQTCPPPAPPPIALQNPEICAGATDAASTTTGMASYVWSASHGSIASSDGNGNVTFWADGSGDVALSVTVTDSNGCPATNGVTVPLHSIDSPATTAPLEMCPYSAGDVSVAPPAGGGTWQYVSWSVTNGYFQTDQYPYQTQWADGASVRVYSNGQGPTTLQAYVTDDQGCNSSATATINVRTIAPPVITAPAELCPYSAGDVSVAPPAGGGVWAYVNWTATNGYFQSDQYPYQTPYANGANVRVYSNGNGPTTLQAYVTDDQGCNNSATATVNVRTIVPPAITAPAELCPYSSGDVSIAPPAGGGTWQYVSWSVTNGYFQTDQYPYQTQWANGVNVRVYSNGQGPTTLQVWASDDQGCNAGATATIGVKAIAPPPINAPASICAGVNAAASVGGTWSYVNWSINNGHFMVGGSPSQWASGPSVVFVADGTEPVTLSTYVTDGDSCSASSSATVSTANPVPAISVTTLPIPVDTTDTAQIASSYTSIQWSIVNGAIVSGGNADTVTFQANDNGPVTLTVNATDASGCSGTGSAQFTIAGQPVVITVPASFCSTTAVKSATAFSNGNLTNIQWTIANGTITSGANTATVSFTPSSFADVTLTLNANVDGSPASATKVVPYVAPSMNPTVSSETACASRAVTVYVPNFADFAQITGHADHGFFTSPFNNDGNYYLLAADDSTPMSVTLEGHTADGCVVTWTHAFRGPSLPAVTLSSPTLCGGGSQTATITNASQFRSSTFFWQISNGVFDTPLPPYGSEPSSVTFHATGTANVILWVSAYGANDDGCSAGKQVIVPVAPAAATPTVTASGPTTFCAGGSVTLTASAASSYLWSTGATTQSITVNASGNYSVAAFDANGCSATSAATPVTVNSSSTPAITTDGPTTFCANASVGLTASAGASYIWSTGTTTQSIRVNTTGDYTVIVTDANGCAATSAPVHVEALPLPVPTVTGIPAAICQGATGHGSVIETFTTYAWSSNNATIVGPTNGQSVDFVAGTPQSCAIFLTVTGANGCSWTYSYNIAVHGAPNPDLLADTTDCLNGTYVANVWQPTQGSTFNWSLTNGTINSVENYDGSPNPNGPVLRYSALAAGPLVITVTETNSDGCTKAVSRTVTVTQPTPMDFTVASVCAGATGTASSVNSYSNYAWSIQNGTILSGANTHDVTFRASTDPANPTVLTLDSPLSGACISPVTKSVPMNSAPTATIAANGPTTFCAGGSVVLTASSGASYLWSTGATTPSISVNASGTYSVTVTNANGCSATSSSTTVTVNPLPVTAITANGPTTFCAGGSVVLTASSGASYLWSTGATSPSISVNASGSYSVTVTDANGCSATSPSTTVTVNPLPVATITANGPTTFCAGGSVMLTASSGASYLWSTGATTPSISVNASGNYSVTVTNANGCSTTSLSTTVTVNPPPVATITPSGPTTFCAGGSVMLTASSGASYLWSTGATTQAITVTAPGLFHVTVTNASNCSATSSDVAVAVNGNPNATITAPSAICNGASGTASVAAITGGSYAWSITGGTINGGNGTSTITFSSTGTTATLNVTVTNSNGCSAPGSAVVAVSANPATPTITPNGPTTFCQGGSVTLTASASSGYHWSTGATTQSIVVTTGGPYTVWVTNANGCASATSAATTVTVNPATAITQQPQSITINHNTTTTLAVTATGTGTLSYQWYNPPTPNNNDTSKKVGTNSPNFTTPKLAHGTYYYYVVVTGSCGTVRSSIATVTSN